MLFYFSRVKTGPNWPAAFRHRHFVIGRGGPGRHRVGPDLTPDASDSRLCTPALQGQALSPASSRRFARCPPPSTSSPPHTVRAPCDGFLGDHGHIGGDVRPPLTNARQPPPPPLRRLTPPERGRVPGRPDRDRVAASRRVVIAEGPGEPSAHATRGSGAGGRLRPPEGG